MNQRCWKWKNNWSRCFLAGEIILNEIFTAFRNGGAKAELSVRWSGFWGEDGIVVIQGTIFKDAESEKKIEIDASWPGDMEEAYLGKSGQHTKDTSLDL
jgi:hypothetical protein